MSEIWTLEQVTLGRDPRPRLRDVTLGIPAGVTAVLGPSGSGKTSLLNLLVEFEKPDTGTVRRSGPTATLPVFWVPPDDGLWPQWTVREHLTRVAPAGSDVAGLLAAFDLESVAEARPERLSQGESSRVALARALASGAPVLVLDEPLVHLEAARGARSLAGLRDWIAAHQTSVVFSTHAPETALLLAEHAICLDEGRVVYAGPLRPLYDAPETAELAWSLGPVNWFDPAEGALWLGEPTAQSLRPERLRIESAADGPLVVMSERFAGAVAEVELQHPATGQHRRVWHRPTGGALGRGERVILRVEKG